MSTEQTPDMARLTPAERAAIYKQRAAAAKAGAAAPEPVVAGPAGAPAHESIAPDQGSAAPAPSEAISSAPSPAAGAPAADMANLSPAERAAMYRQRAAAAKAGSGGATDPAAAPSLAATVAAAAQTKPETPSPPVTAAPKPAAAPAKPAPAPEPAQPEFVGALTAAITGSSWQWRHGYAEVKVPREAVLRAARMLYQAGFDYLSFISEVDWKDRLELVYHLYSYGYQQQPLGAILRTELPREGIPEVASMTAVWPGAEYLEREAFEMMGIRFIGHPDLRRILLPDDFKGFPMRKDYETDYDYVTVKQLVQELDPDFLAGR